MSSRNTEAFEAGRESTVAEVLIQRELVKLFENKPVTIKHQERIGYYVADFLLLPYRIAIECDGRMHVGAKQRSYDKRRDTAMRNIGVIVMRFSNEQILNDVDAVIDCIRDACDMKIVRPLAMRRKSKIASRLVKYSR